MKTLVCTLLGHKWLDLDYNPEWDYTYWFCTRCYHTAAEYHYLEDD